MANSDRKSSSTEPRWRVYALFGLVTVGAALGNLSQTGLNAMLPAVMADFGVAVDMGQWLTTGYMLTLGIAVPIATFLMRRLDDRGYALLGFGLFAAGSVVDWLAPEFFSMLLGRIMQAVAVGLLIPKMQTISMTKFAPGRQATAMGIAGIALGFAPNIGPTVGGVLDFAFGWRSFFLVLLGVSTLLFVLAVLLVKPGKMGSSAERFEMVSFMFSTLGFGGTLLGLSQASSYGFASPWVWVPVAVGAVFLVLFARRQRTVEHPLMDLRIFESRKFTVGLVASLFLFSSYMGITLIIPLLVQNAMGGTSLDTGLIVLPTTVTALLVNPLSGVLADKTSPRLASIVAGTFLVAGSVASVFVDENTPYWLLSAYQATRAIGVSGLIGPLTTYSLAGLKGPLVPHGSSATVIFRQVAATLGTTIMVFCVASLVSASQAGALSVAAPYQIAFAFSAVMSAACMAIVLLRVK